MQGQFPQQWQWRQECPGLGGGAMEAKDRRSRRVNWNQETGHLLQGWQPETSPKDMRVQEEGQEKEVSPKENANEKSAAGGTLWC